MVWDTLNANVPGCVSRSFWANVPLPTPEGPEMTIGRRSGGAASCQCLLFSALGKVERTRSHFKLDTLEMVVGW